MLFFELTLVFGLVGMGLNITGTWAVLTLSFTVAFQVVATITTHDFERFRNGIANRFR